MNACRVQDAAVVPRVNPRASEVHTQARNTTLSLAALVGAIVYGVIMLAKPHALA